MVITHKSLSGVPSRHSEEPMLRAVVYFEYVGKTGLTTIGPITGKRYRFNSNGAVVAVDLRDQAFLLTIPLLKKV